LFSLTTASRACEGTGNPQNLMPFVSAFGTSFNRLVIPFEQMSKWKPNIADVAVLSIKSTVHMFYGFLSEEGICVHWILSCVKLSTRETFWLL
jgi:hypothetical protein